MLTINRYILVYRLLIGYIYAILFSGTILKYFGIPTNIYFIIIAVFDILPLIIWFVSIPSFKIAYKKIFVDTLSFWLIWICVLLLLLLGNYRNHGNITSSILHLGALIRYIPLAYIVISIRKYINVDDRIMKHFKIIGVILIIVGYLCIYLGENATVFLPILPENATGLRETLAGNYAAIFANTIDFAFILLVLYTVFVYKIENTNGLLLTLIFFFPIFKTGSATATVAFLIIAFFRLTQKHLSIRYFLISISVIMLIIGVYEYWDLVKAVIENAKLSRLGMLTLTGPDFISELSLDSFLGVGCDGHVVLEKVNSYQEPVSMLWYAKDGDISMFGDVHWVALLVFHGLMGLGLIVYLYYGLFKVVANKIYLDDNYDYDHIVKWLFFLIVFLSFVNQIIMVKSFAIFFWILLAIVHNKVVTTQTNENTTDQQLQLS